MAPGFDAHRDEFLRRLEGLAKARPWRINSQSGRDWFPRAWNLALLREADAVAAARGIKLSHETHRAKFAYSAAVTADFLRELPGLRLTADFSHW